MDREVPQSLRNQTQRKEGTDESLGNYNRVYSGEDAQAAKPQRLSCCGGMLEAELNFCTMYAMVLRSNSAAGQISLPLLAFIAGHVTSLADLPLLAII